MWSLLWSLWSWHVYLLSHVLSMPDVWAKGPGAPSCHLMGDGHPGRPETHSLCFPFSFTDSFLNPSLHNALCTPLRQRWWEKCSPHPYMMHNPVRLMSRVTQTPFNLPNVISESEALRRRVKIWMAGFAKVLQLRQQSIQALKNCDRREVGRGCSRWREWRKPRNRKT